MRRTSRLRPAVCIGVSLVGGAWIVAGLVSCGTAPVPFIVQGPGGLGNEPPTLDILEPSADLTFGQGDPFLVRWTDADRDSNALITFALENTTTRSLITLVTNIEENDLSGPDTFTVETGLIPPGSYNLVGTISDGVNAPVQAFARVSGLAVPRNAVVTVVEPGQGPQTVPPQIVTLAPAFDLSVAQEDEFTVAVQPTTAIPNANDPYDPDSDVSLFIVLDLDEDPNNDDPRRPAESGIIVVTKDITLPAGASDPRTFTIKVDLEKIPPRPDGKPYFIRATIDDSTNPPVHSYAAGGISVVQLAAGAVDLNDIGRTISGTVFQGFNPGANVGSSLSNVGDFDADGIDDFVIVAQFGNPQNVGPVGEAYLVYGQNRIRFGGVIPVNAVSDTVSGVVFAAPPLRTSVLPDPAARTDGITDVSFISDLTADGRPELLFGLPHVHGAFDSSDYDPGDDDAIGDDTVSSFGCYPDLLVNNFTNASPGCFLFAFGAGCERDIGFFAGGMAIVVNSQNRDSDPSLSPPPPRLDTTLVSLELTGQLPVVLDGGGTSASGGLFPRAHNFGVSADPNSLTIAGVPDPQEAGRIAGARLVAGGFDYTGFGPGPREGLFGQTVRPLGDLGADGVPEIIVSSPRNERYLADLAAESSVFDSQFISTAFVGSITVFPGTNYNITFWRELNDEDGTSRVPVNNRGGSCTGNPPTPRSFFIPAETFEIFAEDIDDMLGEGQSAGDFNRDGVDDILCGAPMNDRNASRRDTGATYIVYGRNVFGEIRLKNADDPVLRPPMLRIRGASRGDQIGWHQASGQDVNGDGIDDVFIASPRTDFGGVVRSCGEDFNGDGVFTATDVQLDDFENCTTDGSEQLFSDSKCRIAFDYDNDGDVDDDDRCVFCCLSTECEVDVSCTFGREANCCADLVDNGFVGVVFGGKFIDGDRSITQLTTSQLEGTAFFGANPGDRAGFDISTAGDFNQDGFGDILIAAPGEVRVDAAGRERLGVVYVVFGGTHLTNATFSLSDVGSEALPGVVFLSPFVRGRPNEAVPKTVGFVGDINNDGFGDIAIGIPDADFLDRSLPQEPGSPPTDPATGRRSNVGEAYVIYGNNFGTNRVLP